MTIQALRSRRALFIETVQAEGGVQVFSVEYLKAVRELCDKYGILLIVDDIQVGCARTGTFFSFERAGIVPDMVVMSKSIGGYGMPFALTMFKPELDIWAPAELRNLPWKSALYGCCQIRSSVYA